MKRVLFYDTETTGLPRWDLPADDPSQPRIVQLAALLCNEETGEDIETFETIIRPDGWTIGTEVANIHGITTEIAAAKGIPIVEALDIFDRLSGPADLLACYNLQFDEKMMRGERRRLGRPDGFGEKRVFCCMRAATPICKLTKVRPGGASPYKAPRLNEAVKIILKREHSGAHSAMADAMAARDIYIKMRSNEDFIAAGSNFPSNKAAA